MGKITSMYPLEKITYIEMKVKYGRQEFEDHYILYDANIEELEKFQDKIVQITTKQGFSWTTQKIKCIGREYEIQIPNFMIKQINEEYNIIK